MRFLFKIFVLPIIITLAVPAALAGVMYKGVDAPTEEFLGEVGDLDIERLLLDEFDRVLLDAGPDSSFNLNISQTTANQAIKKALTEINPNFLDPNAEPDQRDYVIKDSFYGYQGSWARFKDGNIIEIESGLHLFVGGFTYKTRLLLVFKLEVNTEEVVLTLEKLTIGNMPLAWSMSLASWVAERVLNQSIEDMIAEQLEGIGTFDPVARKATVKIDKLLDSAFEEDQDTRAIVDMLLNFIRENELIDIGFEDQQFFVSARVGKIYDGTEPFVLEDQDKIQSDEEMQAILMAKASSVVLSSVSGGNPYLKVDDFTLNRILEYYLRERLTESGYMMETVMLESYSARILLPYITIGDEILVNIPLEIVKENDPTRKFTSIIKIYATPEVIDRDLYFHLPSIAAGEIVLSEENIQVILNMLGDNDIITDGAIVLRNFDEMMSSSGINIKSVDVTNNHLYLYIQLNLFEDLTMVQELAQSALDIVANNPNLPPELAESIQNVLDNIDNEEVINELVNQMIGQMVETTIQLVSENENIPEVVQTALTNVVDNLDNPEAIEQAIADAVAVIQNLDDAEQQALFDEITSALGDTGLSYEDLLGLFPNN